MPFEKIPLICSNGLGMWHINCKFAALNRPYAQYFIQAIVKSKSILTRWMCVQSRKEDKTKANQPLNIQFVGKICLLFYLMLCTLATFIGVFHVPCFISFHDMCYSYRPIYAWYAAICAAGELFIVFVYRIWKLAHVSYPTEFIRHSEWLLHNVPISIFGIKFDYESKLPITCKRCISCNAGKEDDTNQRQSSNTTHSYSWNFNGILFDIG